LRDPFRDGSDSTPVSLPKKHPFDGDFTATSFFSHLKALLGCCRSFGDVCFFFRPSGFFPWLNLRGGLLVVLPLMLRATAGSECRSPSIYSFVLADPRTATPRLASSLMVRKDRFRDRPPQPSSGGATASSLSFQRPESYQQRACYRPAEYPSPADHPIPHAMAPPFPQLAFTFSDRSPCKPFPPVNSDVYRTPVALSFPYSDPDDFTSFRYYSREATFSPVTEIESFFRAEISSFGQCFVTSVPDFRIILSRNEPMGQGSSRHFGGH